MRNVGFLCVKRAISAILLLTYASNQIGVRCLQIPYGSGCFNQLYV